MRIIDPAHLSAHLPDHGHTPRIVASGNHATPWRLLEAADRALPEYRLFMLGALFILVTLLLPKGIVGTSNSWSDWLKARRLSPNSESAAAEDGVSEPHLAE